MIIGVLETVIFEGSFSIEVWIDIDGCVRMRLVFLKVPGDNLEWGGYQTQSGVSQVGHNGLIVGSSILELLTDFL